MFVWLFVEVIVVVVVVVVWLFVVAVVVVVVELLFVVWGFCVVVLCGLHHTPHGPSGPNYQLYHNFYLHNFYPPFHKFYPPLLPFSYHVPDPELKGGRLHDQTKGRTRGRGTWL